MAHETVENKPSPEPRDEHQAVTPPKGRQRIDLGAIDDLQILNEHGEVDAKLDPKLPPDELLRVHRAMVLTRTLDDRMLKMQRQGQMGTFAPNVGQEATQIGQVYPLTSDDWYSPSYRSFGAQMWRGWEIERLMLLWDGYFQGFPPPENVNDLPFSIVIGSHVPLAVGIAMGMNYRNQPHVAMCNFGDGAASEGAVSEGLNFAAVYNAPCIFVLENNGWAISTPVSKQTASPVMAVRGTGWNVPSIRVDGNDILAMIVASSEAAARAREGQGPTLIEAVTFRMSLHTTADDPTVYRKNEEVEAWKRKCPIRRFEKYLTNCGLLDEASIARIARECDEEVLEGRDRFRELAKADPDEIFDFVYEQLPPELEAQKQEYLEVLKRKGV
jgi:pyruvate dehydrogenase E1 component alpha subunit